MATESYQSVARVLLTIVVPFRNSEETLPATLQSLSVACSALHPNDLEILFVDNSSTDASNAIVSAFCVTNANARCVYEPEPGVSAARNAGLAEARGDYIASVDSDDEVAPDYLSELIPLLKQKPDMVLLPFTSNTSLKGPQAVNDRRAALRALPGWWCSQFVFRRALCANLIFSGQCYEDFGFFPRLMQRSDKIIVLYGEIYRYKENPDSLTRKSAFWRLSQLEEVGRDLLSDSALTDRDLVKRVTTDHLRGRMQLRAIAGLWPVLSFRDSASLLLLSQGRRIRQFWQILRLSVSVLRRKTLAGAEYA